MTSLSLLAGRTVTYMLFSVDSRASLRLLYWPKQHIPCFLQSGPQVHDPQQYEWIESSFTLCKTQLESDV